MKAMSMSVGPNGLHESFARDVEVLAKPSVAEYPEGGIRLDSPLDTPALHSGTLICIEESLIGPLLRSPPEWALETGTPDRAAATTYNNGLAFDNLRVVGIHKESPLQSEQFP
ncbi:MAG: hypothetical protein HY226_01540 [Candidatus Vogelbacteria bacterium]|nr:hypothetical protein [Candidatus Vogelbacteria bacterium]